MKSNTNTVSIVGIVSKFRMGLVSNDLRSRESLLEIVTSLKGTKTIVARLNEYEAEGKKIASVNHKKDLKTMVELAKVCISVGADVEWKEIELSTVKKIKAFKTFLEKNDAKDRLKELATVGGVGVNYNNHLQVKMQAIRAEIEPKVVEKAVTLKDAREVVAELGADDKEALLQALMLELGYEVREVA